MYGTWGGEWDHTGTPAEPILYYFNFLSVVIRVVIKRAVFAPPPPHSPLDDHRVRQPVAHQLRVVLQLLGREPRQLERVRARPVGR